MFPESLACFISLHAIRTVKTALFEFLSGKKMSSIFNIYFSLLLSSSLSSPTKSFKGNAVCPVKQHILQRH